MNYMFSAYSINLDFQQIELLQKLHLCKYNYSAKIIFV